MTPTYVPNGPYMQVKRQCDAMFAVCDDCGTVFTGNQYWGWRKHMHLHMMDRGVQGPNCKRATYWIFDAQ